MGMDLVREIFANATATQRLKNRYYWLTTFVGFVAVALALLVLKVELMVVRQLPIPLGVALLVVSLPLVFYYSAVVVAVAFGILMIGLNQFTKADA